MALSRDSFANNKRKRYEDNVIDLCNETNEQLSMNERESNFQKTKKRMNSKNMSNIDRKLQ